MLWDANRWHTARRLLADELSSARRSDVPALLSFSARLGIITPAEQSYWIPLVSPQPQVGQTALMF